MFSYVWPIGLAVAANLIYHICTKSVPEEMNPFASLIVTYLVGAVTAAVMYFLCTKNGNLLREYSHLNWSSIVLGIAIVGLEVGFIYTYKAGWQVSTAAVVQSAFLAIALLAVGYLFYKEALTPSKIAGMAICLVGLYFINK